MSETRVPAEEFERFQTGAQSRKILRALAVRINRLSESKWNNQNRRFSRKIRWERRRAQPGKTAPAGGTFTACANDLARLGSGFSGETAYRRR